MLNSCQDSLDLYKQQVLKNSGKFFDQLGIFYQCTNYPLMQYYQLQFIDLQTDQLSKLFWGLCLPNTCSQDQIRNGMDYILQNANITFKVGPIHQNPQLYSYQYDWTFYLTCSIIATVTLLTFIATILPKIKQLQSFNLSKNLGIFHYKKNPLNVFNGIKSICMMWVILGHQYSVRLGNSLNLITIGHQVQQPFFLVVTAAFFAVDVFFYIGGFLVAYSFLRAQFKSIIKYPMALLRRLLRFWPSYIMVILILFSVYMHVGWGPLWWEQQVAAVQPCRRIWKPLLFVDNLVDNGADMCMGWGWYLQNDMQIFVFSLLILFIYSKSKIISYITILLTCLGSFIFSFYITYVNQYVHVAHMPDFLKWNQYFTDVYIKPWIRCPPYLYGLLLGMFYVQLLKIQKKIKQNPNEQHQQNWMLKLKNRLIKNHILKWTMQIFGFGLILFWIFIPRTLQIGYKWPQTMHSAYLTFSQTFFVIGVSLLVTPSLLGIKSKIQFMMDTKFFNVISKVSFWTYLIHYMVVMRTDFNQKIDFYYTAKSILPAYSAHVLLSILLGFLGTMLVQVPFSKLEKKFFEVILKSNKSKQKQDKVGSAFSITSSLTSSQIGSNSNSSIVSPSLLSSNNQINRASIND